jgi:trimeric autotransporter adhesin
MKKITLLFLLFGFSTFMSAQCLTSVNGQYPTSATPYTPATCDGVTVNSITTLAYASEHSIVNVTSGQTYVFSSSIATDLITISNEAGDSAFIFGTGSVTWVATITGVVRFYTHLNDGSCGAESSFRARRIVCGTPPTCVAPTALVVSSITTNSAAVSWTASTTPPANGYEYYLSTSITAPTAETQATGSVTAGTLTADLMSLSSGTTYYVWVRSVCSGSDSSTWSTRATFNTLCVSVTEFTQNFDAAVAYPACWAKVGTLGTANVQALATAPSSPNVLYMYSGSAASQAVVSMPPVSNAGTGTHQLRFKARAYFTVGGVIEVGYLTNPTDATSFVSLQSFTTTSITVFDNFVATLGTAPSTNEVLAFRVSGTPAYSVLIDDVVWEQMPTCIAPTALTSSNLAATSATISWAASTTVPADGYDYYVSTANTAPTATTVATGNVNALTANLINLTSATTYYYWVRSVCSSSDMSSWSTVASFTTTCTAATVPYTIDFESVTTPALPACTTIQNAGTGNNWTTAAAPGYGFTSKVLRYAWNGSNPANTWFYTNGITLEAGTSYSLSYKYGNNSTTFVEKLKVAFGTAANNTAMVNVVATHDNITGGTTTSTANQNTVQITVPTTGVYYFGFNAFSAANQFYLFVDDIAVTEQLSNASFDSNKVSVYPNPVKDVLNIEVSTTISEVIIYNLLGQQIMTKVVNANESSIDVSSLNSGTYLVKVIATEGSTKTVKVIKQ